jgi:hypothetical protein
MAMGAGAKAVVSRVATVVVGPRVAAGALAAVTVAVVRGVPVGRCRAKGSVLLTGSSGRSTAIARPMAAGRVIRANAPIRASVVLQASALTQRASPIGHIARVTAKAVRPAAANTGMAVPAPSLVVATPTTAVVRRRALVAPARTDPVSPA